MPSRLPIRVSRFKSEMFFFPVRERIKFSFSRVINLVLAKLPRGRDQHSVLHVCLELALLSPCCQDLWPIFFLHGSNVWKIMKARTQSENELVFVPGDT